MPRTDQPASPARGESTGEASEDGSGVELSTALRLVGRTARAGVFRLDCASQRLRWSDEVCALYEVPRGTHPTLAEWLGFCGPAHQASLAQRVRQCERDGAPFEQEIELHTAGGRSVWLRVVGEAEQDEIGQVRTVVGVIQDVDEPARLRAQLQEAQKMASIGRLTGAVAHDFNNLLSVVLGYTMFTLDDLPDDSPLRPDVHEVLLAARRGADLTRQLLALGRHQPFAPERLDLNEILRALESMLRRLVPEDVELTVHTSAQPAEVHGDRGQLEQVLLNLVLNARDAMPRGGALTLTCLASGDDVSLRVRDDGLGMDAPTRARIFEPFFTTKEPGQGTGLGLTTVLDIVRRSGGRIDVHSAPDAGTTIEIHWPRLSARAEAPPSPATTQDGGTVLLVEDDEPLRRMLALAMRRAGLLVLDAATGAEALALARRHAGALDLLVTDLVLPRLGGRELAQQLTAERPALRVLYLSGHGDHPARARASGDGARCLAKPLTPDALLDEVKRALRGPR